MNTGIKVHTLGGITTPGTDLTPPASIYFVHYPRYTYYMSSNAPLEGRFSIIRKLPFFYGWVMLPVAALALFMSGPGQTYTISVFIDPMIAELGWSRTMVSGLYTAGSLTAGAAMILVGRLLDRYGARVLLTVVTIVFGLAALWMSQVDQPAELYLGMTAVRALGQGSLMLISTTLIAIWFVEKRGKAVAISMLGMAASQAIFPIITLWLIENLGWRNAWATLGFALWGVLLLPIVLLVRRSPESIGQKPDGRKDTTIELNTTPNSTVSQEVSFSLHQAMKQRTFWLLLITGMGLPMITTATFFHHISLMGSKGIDPAVAASVYIIVGPTNMVGNFTAGLLSDKIRNRFLLVAGQLMLIASLLWLLTISSPWQAIVYGGIIGFTIGFSSNINTVIWANYFGRLSLGSIRGVASTCMVISAALGPLPFGLLFDQTGTYSQAILYSLALPLVCTITALLAKPPRTNTIQIDL